jgi:hypothetical protein
MSIVLEIARGAAIANVLILLLLGYVWGGNYRRHGATHTLGLLTFATFLVVQNLLWLYLYVFHSQFVAWFVHGGLDIQLSVTGLCGLQTIALVFLARITWR